MRGAAYEDSTHGITHFLKKRSETQVSNKTILEMKHINKSFPGVRALQDVDFTLCGGEIHALMGENGAGKSTLIKVLTGVYEKDDGQIFVEGNEEATLSDGTSLYNLFGKNTDLILKED